MDGSKPGEAGVLAWCNSIRLNIAADSGRELLATQIQKQGFDFLESYLESIHSRPKEEPVYELLKTPSRKKDAPKRTRTAVALAARVKAANLSLSEDNSAPVNDFHKALLQVKDEERTSANVHSQDTHGSDNAASLKWKSQKVVTIDSPDAQRIEVDDSQTTTDIQAPSSSYFSFQSLDTPALFDTKAPEILPSEGRSGSNVVSARVLSPTGITPAESAEHSLGGSSSHSTTSTSTELEPESAQVILVSEPSPDDVYDFAAGDFNMHAMGPKDLSIIAEGDEPEESKSVTHQSAEDPTQEKEIMVPLRDESSTNSLKRKPSMSQFSGLPAPSPLRKSMRISREPSVGQGLSSMALSHTPGTNLSSKRTSWLSKAQQAKALEVDGTGRRALSRLEAPSGILSSVSGSDVKDVKESNKRKSGEMLGLGFVFPRPGSLDSEDDRKTKAAKLADIVEDLHPHKGKQKAASLDNPNDEMLLRQQGHHGSLPLPQLTPEPVPTSFHATDDMTVQMADLGAEEDDVLDRLKKTVEDLGARAGKGMGKSLGGNAAAALAEMAEARAAAAARVAQRARQEGEVDVLVESQPSPTDGSAEAMANRAEPHGVVVADVETAPSENKDPHVLEPVPVVSQTQEAEGVRPNPHPIPQSSNLVDTSTSTTPPNSPPIVHVQDPLPPPVFSQPPPVFTAPPAASHNRAPPQSQLDPKDFSFKLPSTHPFSLPATSLGISAAFPSSSNVFSLKPPALSAQTSKTSVFSDAIFDKEDHMPAWMQATQDTDLSLHAQEEDMDEDDSWHLDDKFKSNQTWTPFGFTSADKDDTSTWGSFPARSTSQKGEDTGPILPMENVTGNIKHTTGETSSGGNNVNVVVEETRAFDLNPEFDQPPIDTPVDMDIDDVEQDPLTEGELNDLVASGKPTISLVKSKPDQPRSQSQQSVASSTSSSQSQLGFIGQASRFVSSMLSSTTKKGKEPVKSLALAAAAAKKQQEEAEKKATRLKEMEQRRQQALQRKAEEEKARIEEEKQKLKDDVVRRKREREETTEKRPLKNGKKGEDDTTKKRLTTAEVEKKPDAKKPPSKDGQSSRNVKPAPNAAPNTAGKSTSTFKHLAKQPSVTSLASSSIPKAPGSEAKATLKTVASSSNLKSTTGKGKAPEKEDVQPAQMVQSQMAHRAKAHMQAVTPRQAPPVTSESIELPDIHSEYSDSDDEDRPRTFDPPEWAQSPELRQALEQQSHMNPDEIFGRIGPLRMEEIFRTRQSRFRSRTSSANWAGPDQLTADEEREYARRMGFN